ncbi:hypothetical protein SAMN05216198_1923 [Halopseudomonas litoralis]|uniref:Uncharacterized protein n=1 Tax=Halopseudomonas litoralis TaxID=797277 RepID=A0A1H1S3M7_9GAMM|nr:hypothetical protein [Halopseudomonas litoralis]SDS42700.1 hypothetical protein SAMN05216198_1923 [Halopseudomonas litoralis]
MDLPGLLPWPGGQTSVRHCFQLRGIAWARQGEQSGNGLHADVGAVKQRKPNDSRA